MERKDRSRVRALWMYNPRGLLVIRKMDGIEFTD